MGSTFHCDRLAGASVAISTKRTCIHTNPPAQLCTRTLATWTKWFLSRDAITQPAQFTCNEQQSMWILHPVHTLMTPLLAFSADSCTDLLTSALDDMSTRVHPPPFPHSCYSFFLLWLMFCLSFSTSFPPFLHHLVTLSRNKPICRIDLEP